MQGARVGAVPVDFHRKVTAAPEHIDLEAVDPHVRLVPRDAGRSSSTISRSAGERVRLRPPARSRTSVRDLTPRWPRFVLELPAKLPLAGEAPIVGLGDEMLQIPPVELGS